MLKVSIIYFQFLISHFYLNKLRVKSQQALQTAIQCTRLFLIVGGLRCSWKSIFRGSPPRLCSSRDQISFLLQLSLTGWGAYENSSLMQDFESFYSSNKNILCSKPFHFSSDVNWTLLCELHGGEGVKACHLTGRRLQDYLSAWELSGSIQSHPVKVWVFSSFLPHTWTLILTLNCPCRCEWGVGAGGSSGHPVKDLWPVRGVPHPSHRDWWRQLIQPKK